MLRMTQGSNAGLSALYHDAVSDHHRRPRNKREFTAPMAASQLKPHVRGVKEEAQLAVRDGVLRDGVLTEVTFGGRGCAISQASAAMLTHLMRERTPLAGAARFPARVRCASIGWGRTVNGLKTQKTESK